MNKIVEELLELKFSLLCLREQYRVVEKHRKFEESFLSNNNHNNYGKHDSNMLSHYIWTSSVPWDFDGDFSKEWNAIDNFLKMFNLARDNAVEAFLKEFKSNYEFLFDWLNDYSLTKISVFNNTKGEYWDGKEWHFKRVFRDELVGLVNSFRNQNKHVLNIEKALLLDALKNDESILLNELSLFNESPVHSRFPKKLEKLRLDQIQNIRRKILESFLPQVEEKIKKTENDIIQSQKKMIATYGIAAIRNDIELNNDKKIIEEINNVINQLELKYSLIKKTDWKNIDEIIYFIDSGRADTIKEALLLVDQLQYKNEIVAAADRISDTLRVGFEGLYRTLDYNFAKMFDHLENISSNLLSVASEISNNTVAINQSSIEVCSVLNKIAYK